MLDLKKYFILLSFFILFKESSATPVGKGLYCVYNKDGTLSNYQEFRGLYFETNESVRVVTFKNKNKSLKAISKQTPYKISEEKIEFKIKFIWYGNISFENFVLNRKDLSLKHENNNAKNFFHCKILDEEFMFEMEKFKSQYQLKLNDKLKNNKI